CHRAFHSQGHLSWKGTASGVVFGFLRTISDLHENYPDRQIVFCFEGHKLYRKSIYSEYKNKRRVKTPEEQRAYDELSIQITEIEKRYLPQIGFKNIFRFHGYE